MVTWLIVLIIVLILVIAVDVVVRSVTATSWGPRAWTGMQRFWRAFFPHFIGPSNLTEVFRLLIGVMFVFGALLFTWSIGAAMLRAGYLVAARPAPMPALSQPENFPDTWQGVAFLVLEVLRAAGGILALCFSSGLVGGLLGFLFGLPRPAPAGASGTPPSARRSWQTSTNLTEVADWLTKIIIGVGLVTATQIWGGLIALSDFSRWLVFQRPAR